MTVRELIELNAMITDVTIWVRKDGSLLLDYLAIGAHEGIKPPYPVQIPKSPEWAGKTFNNRGMAKDGNYIRKNINSWDDGKDYWQVKPERIPKKYLGLTVYSWNATDASVWGCPRRTIEGKFRNVSFNGIRLDIIAGQEGWTPFEEKHAPKVEENNGQMTLDDWFASEEENGEED